MDSEYSGNKESLQRKWGWGEKSSQIDPNTVFHVRNKIKPLRASTSCGIYTHGMHFVIGTRITAKLQRTHKLIFTH